MHGGDRDLDTICAVATPHGVGGISVIRVSGKNSLSNTCKIAEFLRAKKLQSHQVYFGNIQNLQGEAIDEVLVTYFANGKSFTGEETLEISCHGSPFIANAILNELVKVGCRIADRGEFTYRAFMNNRIDLVQAESVLDMIQAQSSLSAKQALNQLKGQLSKRLEHFEDRIIWCLAHIEASIDFSTEGIDVVDFSSLRSQLVVIRQEMQQMAQSFDKGRILREGLSVVFSGRPNVGKSSLFNLVIGEDKAIVTNIAGTTRDLLDSMVLIEGILIKFLDTAGVREATDLVEKIGINKAVDAQRESDLVFYVVDSAEGLTNEDHHNIGQLNPLKSFVIFNKVDLLPGSFSQRHDLIWSQINGQKSFQNFNLTRESLQNRVILASAVEAETSVKIRDVIVGDIRNRNVEDLSVISNSRHFENLSRAGDSLERAGMLIENEQSVEFVAIELKEALLCVQETLGKRFDDQVMDRVFKEFCIGK